MELKKAQDIVDQWIKEHGVRYFNELTNMAQLTEEVGEVARIIARRYGEQSEKRKRQAQRLGGGTRRRNFCSPLFGQPNGCRLQSAFDKKMKFKAERDHDRHQNNPKLK